MEPKVRTQLFEPSRPVYTKVRDDMPTATAWALWCPTPLLPTAADEAR